MSAGLSRRDLLCFWRRPAADPPADPAPAPAAPAAPSPEPDQAARRGDGFSLEAFYRARAAARPSPPCSIEHQRSTVPDVARGVWLASLDDQPPLPAAGRPGRTPPPHPPWRTR